MKRTKFKDKRIARNYLRKVIGDEEFFELYPPGKSSLDTRHPRSKQDAFRHLSNKPIPTVGEEDPAFEEIDFVGSLERRAELIEIAERAIRNAKLTEHQKEILEDLKEGKQPRYSHEERALRKKINRQLSRELRKPHRK